MDKAKIEIHRTQNVHVKSNALGFAFVCADALLMCLLVMSLNLFFLMHAPCESYGPDVCFLWVLCCFNLVSLMLLSLMLLHNLRCVALMGFLGDSR
jgi:hypothetical protein